MQYPYFHPTSVLMVTLHASQQFALSAWLASPQDLPLPHLHRPPREYEFPQFVEVNYFLHSCDLLKLSVRETVAPDQVGNAAAFRFCKYCWRIALPNRQTCPVHSPGKNLNAMVLPLALKLESSTPSGRHKEAYRQKHAFDAHISKRLTPEFLEFHDRNMDAGVFFPAGDWMTWLVQRRPLVWDMLVHVAPNAPNVLPPTEN